MRNVADELRGPESKNPDADLSPRRLHWLVERSRYAAENNRLHDYVSSVLNPAHIDSDPDLAKR